MEFEHLHSFCNQPPGGVPFDSTSHMGTLEHQEGAHRSPCRKWPRSLPAGSSRAGTRLARSGAPGADGACREPGASMDAWCCHGPVYSD